ncbi:ribosomal RNA small subunit methyltransferase A [Candidatus Nomurabacteria bacterium]|nr:ribosomal RNA small subunit methyltransferase A [Candidatus Nomurabacteria bacterium]USN94682.1 MAG: ribosomal RNA small subunit methyltransferase A [Candidatus Nomurabacteria bacterium]
MPRPKKSLGQNFLKQKRFVTKIIDSADLKTGDLVLEIGPGYGAITEEVLARGFKVLAIEKDDAIVLHLKEKFKKEIADGKLHLVSEDVADFDISKIKKLAKSYKVVANIPYYITGLIIRKFLSSDFQPQTMSLLVQNEVAKRIVKREEGESILALSVWVYGTPEYITKVPKEAFRPVPKVESAIISIKNISKKNFKNHKEEEGFFELIKTAFLHKRKKAIKNIEDLYDEENLKEIWDKLGLEENHRPEEINLDKWISISRARR